MYFLLALIVAAVSLFVPALIGAMINREEVGRTIGIASVFTIVYALILWWAFWGLRIGVYGPVPFILPIIIGAAIAWMVVYACTEEASGTIPAIVIIAGYLLYALLVADLCNSSNMFHADEKAKLIGEIQTVSTLEDLIQPADNAHICLVSQEIATTSAQNALSQITLDDGAIAGSRYTIGEPVKQFVDGSYWWIFPLEFDGYFKWKQDSQVPGYLRVSAEDPAEQPQAVQTDKSGEEIHVKYLNSACFEYKAERYLRNNGYLFDILKDWTYEVDDNWRPYYTVTVVKRTLGFFGEVTQGVVVLDVQTGDIEFQKIGETDSWIDRVVSLDTIDYNAKKWGEYANAGWWYNIWHDDKSQQPTPGWFLTYDGEKCQWFTGFTSTNSEDNALTGFMLVDARTGESSYFKTNGVTEQLAYEAALNLWNNYGDYITTELVPYNIYGYLTYVIPMQCNNQFSGVSLVCLSNINIKAKGDTLEQALQNYRTAIGNASQSGITPNSGLPDELEVTGTVERIGLPTASTSSTVVSFKLAGIGKIFQVTYSETNPEPIIINVGDTVKITYSETTEIVVPVTSFDIVGVDLEKGSVIQSQAVEEQQNTNEEVARIEDQESVQNIIDSGDLSGVDPNALQDFINEQNQQK